MKIQISPGVQIGIGLGVTILTLAAKGTITLPTGIPPSWGPVISSWSNFLLQLYAPLATAMAAYSSSQPGPLAPPDPPEVVRATAVVAAKGTGT